MLRNFRQVFKGNQTPMAVVMMVVLLGMVAYLAPSHGNPTLRTTSSPGSTAATS